MLTAMSLEPMSSSFTTLEKTDQGFSQFHPQTQIYCYPNMHSTSGMSLSVVGTFTPTVGTICNFPRTIPVSRWNHPCITLDKDMDYNLMTSSDEGSSRVLGTEEWFLFLRGIE
ncbi:uncharacterized protein LOC143230984 [Tachypleus tridentatus]|uniref:uncharacterized protein LOC143230984 n=1 Tax=Tachypleus tridentatus TaxID=6853 RepID=UPI003FD43EBF